MVSKYGWIHPNGLSYALIPNAEGQLVILYREPFYSQHVQELNGQEFVDVIGYVGELDPSIEEVNELKEVNLDDQQMKDTNLDDDELFYDAYEDFLSWEDKGKEHEEFLSIYDKGSTSRSTDPI
jgi:hypothetical protein